MLPTPAALAALLALGAPGPAPGTALGDVAAAVPDAVVDLRYATARNLAGRALYPAARCLLLAPVTDRLRRAAEALRAAGRRLVLWDCYRPLAVQRELWRLRPDARWVADPARGSRHSRGAAVDVALADAGGRLVELPTDHDAFVAAARPDAVQGVSAAAAANRLLLRQAMEGAGFHQNRGEWWHYDAPEGVGAPLLDVPLAAAASTAPPAPRP